MIIRTMCLLAIVLGAVSTVRVSAQPYSARGFAEPLLDRVNPTAYRWAVFSWVANTQGSTFDIQPFDVLGAHPSSAVNLGDAPGDYATTGDLGEIFLCTRNELLVLRRSAAQAYTTAWSQSFAPSRELTGVAYSTATSSIYLLDATGYVLQAPYLQGGPKPVSWAPLVTPSMIPVSILPQLAEYELRIDPDSPSQLVASMYGQSANEDAFTIDHTISPPSVGVALVPGIESERVALTSYFAPGDTTVEVTGPAGSLVSILRIDQPVPVTVGMAQLNGTPGQTVSVQAPVSSFVMEGVYAAQHASSPRIWAPFLSPRMRWVSTDTLPSGVTFANIGDASPTEAGGLADVSLSVDVPAGLTTSNSYPAMLLVNVMSTPPPIDFSGPNPVLIPAATVNETATINPNSEDAVPMFLEVPQGAEGAVYLFQWIVQAGSTYRVSDIVGTIAIAPTELSNPHVVTAAASSAPTVNQTKTGPVAQRTAIRSACECNSGLDAVSGRQGAAIVNRIRRAAR